MSERIRFVYLLIIVLISLGTLVACDSTCRQLDGTEVPCMGSSDSPSCDEGETLWSNCGCLPDGIDCCSNRFAEFVGPCNEDEPVCCPGGTCASDFTFCPDAIDCPDFRPQPCGAFCISEDETCCNNDLPDSAQISCPFGAPICCPLDPFQRCAASIEEC